MQYPLENLHIYVKQTLHPQQIEKHFRHNGGTALLPGQLNALKETTRISICQYYATAQNSLQSHNMLQTMLACLRHLLETTAQYKEQLKPLIKEADTMQEMVDCYNQVIDCTGELLEFLHIYFKQGRPEQELTRQYKTNTAANIMITTSLSVPQLALFVKLMVDTGIIAQDNITFLAQATALNIKTKKAGQVSAESLCNKYYTPEKHTIDIMHEYVKRMQQQLRSYG